MVAYTVCMTKTGEKRKRLAVIDGKSVFYRGYYAMGSLSTKDGTPTGGVYGFAAMALELLKKLQPDYVCVAWDKPKTNIRKRLEVYPGYKAGRKPAPPDFYVQIPILHELLRAFNWPLYELDDYEADDIMHTLARKADKAGLETMLITSDLDSLQSISEHTHVYALKKGFSNIERFDVAAFEAKYGIDTEQFLDLKSLKGDSSDNIPGVPGIGEKGALDLLKAYDSLDGVYENIDLVKESVRKKLVAGKDSAYMSKEVAQLYDDAPVDLDLAEMDVRKLDTAELREILQRLEFRTLLRNLPDHMQASQTDIAKRTPTHQLDLIEATKTTVVTKNNISVLKKLNTSQEIVLHGRASGKHGTDPMYLLLADEQMTYVLDIKQLSASDLKTVSSLKISKVIGHDLKAAMQMLISLDVKLPTVFHDTLVGAFIINSLRREQSLSDLLRSDLGIETQLDELDDEEYVTRAGELSESIRVLANAQGEQISELSKVIQLVDKIEWPIIPVLARMEKTGILITPPFFEQLSDSLADKLSDIEQTIYGYADQEFNIASPAQLSQVLFVDLKLPTAGVKKGKTGSYSTAADVLEKLKDLHPIIACINQFREYAKLKSTYVDTLPGQRDDQDRIHTTFNITIAQTGRLSSINPNLQNIPVRTELGREIRKGFVAGKGRVFVSADYSQFELRIAAAMSEDQGMIDAFNADRDIHTETAALIQGVKPEDVTKDMRYAAKAVNFGILYGQGVHGLSAGTGISYADAKAFIDKYFEVRPKLKGMIETFREHALKRGYVETLLGRRRPTPDAKSSNFIVREAAFRAAINMPIQGTAADLTKLAMIRVQEEFDKAFGEPSRYDDHSGAPQMLLQIHDSIMVECNEADADKVGALMKETMEQVYPDLGVTLCVDVSTGRTWGDL
ncbi:DNA polymerase I [Patescibacteria group bacterium]|nr:MAG: DNA polymerase I [Patescibacteria group bacterium]